MSLLGSDKLQFLIESARLAPDMGLFIEVGVYQGGSINRLAEEFPSREIIGFDTFNGMPEQYYGADEIHQVGEFGHASFESVQEFLSKHVNVSLIKGVFPNSSGSSIYEFIAFAHIDIDYWRGTLAALEFIWPRVTHGGVILFDDFEWKNCPGIAPIVRTWAVAMNCDLEIKGNQARIIKK